MGHFLLSLVTLPFYFSSLDINSGLCRSSTSILSYEVYVIPRFNFPAICLERIIRSDLPVNLQALAYRAERNFMEYQKLPLPENHLHKTSAAINGSSSVNKIDGALCESDKKPIALSDSLSTASSEVSSNWGIFGKVCRLERPSCMVDEVHLRRFDGLLVNYEC